jgi:hypothetical protein
MAGSTDLIGAFRAYAQKALGNDFNPEKAAAALNSWVKESGDALKIRIERETERAVKKLGLAKESDLHALQEEISDLRKQLGLKKKSAAKKPATRRGKTATKKAASKRSAQKSVQKKAKKTEKKSKG